MKPKSNFYRTIGVTLVLIGVLGVLAACVTQYAEQADFKFYWTGFQLLKAGQNPYDSVAQGMTVNCNWFPPFLYLILAPVLVLPYKLAVLIWFLCGVGLIATTGYLAFDFFGARSRMNLFYLILGVFIAPTLVCLKFGQLGILLSLGLVGFFWAIQREKYFLSGVFLLLTFCKPHLFYLVYLVFGLWIVRQKMWKILVPLLAAVAAILAITHVVFPHSFHEWLSAYSKPPLYWKTATFVTFIRSLIPSHPAWVIMFVPFLSALVCLCYYGLRQRPIEWKQDIPGLILWSLFTAPYGWIFDHAVLVITQCASLALIMNSPAPYRVGQRAFYLIVCYQLIFAILMLTLFRNEYWGLFWYPIGQWLVWRWSLSLTAAK